MPYGLLFVYALIAVALIGCYFMPKGDGYYDEEEN